MTDVGTHVEGIDIDTDSADWQPYFSFVEALREKIARAEPTGKTSITAVVRSITIHWHSNCDSGDSSNRGRSRLCSLFNVSNSI